MGTLAVNPDERVDTIECSEDSLIVGLKDGRRISVPIEWYPRLARASKSDLANWQISGGGYGIHWPDLDEDLSTEGLLRGAPAKVSMDATERLQRDFELLPPDKQDQVLDFVAWIKSRYGTRSDGGESILGHVGQLKDSPNLNGDPVRVQQSLRDE